MTDFPSFTYHVKPLLGDLIKNVTSLGEGNAVLKAKDFRSFVLSAKNIYIYSDPLVSAIFWCLIFAVLVLILSTITRNFSQVDRLWSILPVFFTWHFILHGCWKSLLTASLSTASISSTCNLNTRGIILGLLTTVWGTRLTYNYTRKGGYKWKSEDYRWSFVRQRINWIIFEITNVIFISLYQCLLLMAMTFPSYSVWYTASTSLNLWDLFASIMFIGFLIGETIADNQQWKFQSEKHKLIAEANKNSIKPMIFEGDYAMGFTTHGLFRYSRHPNYFCEMGIWWSYYLFSIAAASSKSQWILNWTMIGTFNLTILFQITTYLTEKITRKKYPMYELYRKNTSRLIPWLPGKDITKKKK